MHRMLRRRPFDHRFRSVAVLFIHRKWNFLVFFLSPSLSVAPRVCAAMVHIRYTMRPHSSEEECALIVYLWPLESMSKAELKTIWYRFTNLHRRPFGFELPSATNAIPIHLPFVIHVRYNEPSFDIHILTQMLL